MNFLVWQLIDSAFPSGGFAHSAGREAAVQHRIQAELSAHIDAVIHDCRAVAPHDIAQTAPLIDLFQSTHDRLYSRLFQS